MLHQFRLSDRHRSRHRDCTVQTCLQNDENTTTIPQHHLCRDPDACPTVTFPTKDVNDITNPEDGATAWSISSTPATLGSDRYMAISHVWSDGTGIGLKGSGNVNHCLVEHFKTLAMGQKCDGIWWDTISLPTDKGKRIMALNKMHNNYSMAACTLAHDLELADFTWADDGSPCLALASSTWFSRGWTAMELYMSKSVLVLFKDSYGSPVLKDLDRDILANPDDPFVHPTHVQVSKVVRRLRTHGALGRGRDPWSVDEVLDVLRLRYTCWTRDRSIIAGLMISERSGDRNWFDSTWSQTDITKNILTKCQSLSPYALFHDRVPICESGPLVLVSSAPF